jgi:DNA-binding NtrC family response regulator
MSPTVQRVLVVDDEAGICEMIRDVLTDSGYQVETFTDPKRALEAYRPGGYEVVVTDIRMPKVDGLSVLEHVRSRSPAPPVIVITAYATVDTSIQALRRGAYDMLTKPFEPDELIQRVRNAVHHERLAAENRALRDQLAAAITAPRLIGESNALGAVLAIADKVAARDFPVLITGESGTGKELVARTIHLGSPRAARPFVAINCGALAQTLLESELFGVRKGAFTGADQERTGLIQAADGGTLFLDEVGNLPADVQKLLLRFLQEKEFYRVGDTQPTRVDVRVVAATNADLKAEVAQGRFREDLYYRLAVGRVRLPPLRERPGDIPLLVAHFVQEQNQRFPSPVQGISPAAMAYLASRPWPGNVRQLKNVIEASMALEQGHRLTVETLAGLLGEAAASGTTEAAEADWATRSERFEASYFGELLERHAGNVEAAAREAGVNLATLYRKIKRHGLRGDD